MGKSKVAQAGKPAKVAEVKALSSVKGGAVTKPSQTPKSKSKELAKQVAAKSDEGRKKSKKSKKEPTPEPSSESESDSDKEMSSASSADSDDGSEDEAVPVAKTNGAVSNGVAKNAGGDTSDSSESSDDEDEPAVAGAPQGAISADSSDDDSADDSEDDSGDESDVESGDEVAKPNGATDAQVLKGKLGEVATKDVCLLTVPGPNYNADEICRLRPPSQTQALTTLLMPKRLQARLPTLMSQVRVMKKKRRLNLCQARSARLMLSLPLLRKKPRRKLPLPMAMVARRETFSWGTCRGMLMKNG